MRALKRTLANTYAAQAPPKSLAEMSKQQKHQLLAWHSQGKDLPPHQLALVEAIKFEYIESAKRRNRGEPVRMAQPPSKMDSIRTWATAPSVRLSLDALYAILWFPSPHACLR